MATGMLPEWLVQLTSWRARVPTIGGWTPGIRALVRGRQLPCGCLAGLYERSSGQLDEIIDAVGARCAGGHARNGYVPPPPVNEETAAGRS